MRRSITHLSSLSFSIPVLCVDISSFQTVDHHMSFTCLHGSEAFRAKRARNRVLRFCGVWIRMLFKMVTEWRPQCEVAITNMTPATIQRWNFSMTSFVIIRNFFYPKNDEAFLPCNIFGRSVPVSLSRFRCWCNYSLEGADIRVNSDVPNEIARSTEFFSAIHALMISKFADHPHRVRVYLSRVRVR